MSLAIQSVFQRLVQRGSERFLGALVHVTRSVKTKSNSGSGATLFRSKRKSDLTETSDSKKKEAHIIQRLIRDPKKKQQTEGDSEDAKSYFIEESGLELNPKQRIFGSYFKLTKDEIAQFHSDGFLKVENLLSVEDEGELYDIRLTVDALLDGYVSPDSASISRIKVPSFVPDSMQTAEKQSKLTTAKSSDWLSTFGDVTNVERIADISSRSQHKALGVEHSFRGNVFESRCLSAARQIFAKEMCKRKKACDLEVAKSDLLLIEKENRDMHTAAKCKEPVLVALFSPFREVEVATRRLRVAAVMPLLSPAVFTMKLMDSSKAEQFTDGRNVMPNVALTSGSALLFDPRKIDQVLLWKISSFHNAFLTAVYSLKT